MFKEWEAECLQSVDGVGQIPTLQCIFPLFTNVVNAALVFGSVIALFFLIWGGFKFLRSQGDQKQVTSARQTITYAILGLIIVFLSFAIINTVAFITGAECIKDFSFKSCET